MNAYSERASLEGFEIEIFKLVSRSATAEQWAEWLRVPLEHAAAQGNHGLVDKLLGAGGNGRAGWKGCGGRSLLYAAALGGSEDVLSSLLQAGAKPEVNVLVPASTGRSPLYQAVSSGHEAAARLLVMAGADINFVDPADKLTLLHQALLRGHEQLARELMIGGADVEARDSLGSTALHLAAMTGLGGIISSILLRGVDKNAVTDEGGSALMYASGFCNEAHLAVVETLLAAGADVTIRTPKGYSALDWASRKGHVPVIEALVRHGADVNSRGGTQGQGALHNAAIQDQACSVEALIKAGADIEMKMKITRRTPLGLAAETGKSKAVLALLQKGAATSAQDNVGDSPLHLACFYQRERIEGVVDALLRWGADETALNNDGKSPADLLDSVYKGRKCSQEDIERVRLLLARAPADRAWRRRGWLAMLRSRASRSKPIAGGGHEEGSSGASGGAEGSRKVARSEAAGGVGSGEGAHATNGVGEEMGAVGDELFGGAVVRLVGLEPEGVFRAVLEFL